MVDERMDAVRDYLRWREIPRDLSVRIRRYYEHCTQARPSSYFLHTAGSGTPRQTPSQPKQQRGLRSQAPFSAPEDQVGW